MKPQSVFSIHSNTKYTLNWTVSPSMKSKILAREKVSANCLKELKKGDCAGDISIHPGFKSSIAQY